MRPTPQADEIARVWRDSDAALRTIEPDLGLRSEAPAIVAEPEPASRICGNRAALFASGPLKVWVTRIGTIRWRNPLRPMAPERMTVLQVAVNGRSGSAYGPDFDNLRQGSASRDLEDGNPEPVHWDAALEEVPPSLRVVAEDGRVLLGPLPFQACEEAPKVTRTARAPAQREPGTDDGPPTTSSATRDERARPAAARPSIRPVLPMPQGAIR